jgi:hypothetical protein
MKVLCQAVQGAEILRTMQRNGYFVEQEFSDASADGWSESHT